MRISKVFNSAQQKDDYSEVRGEALKDQEREIALLPEILAYLNNYEANAMLEETERRLIQIESVDREDWPYRGVTVYRELVEVRQSLLVRLGKAGDRARWKHYHANAE
jgi:hypothetical protein